MRKAFQIDPFYDFDTGLDTVGFTHTLRRVLYESYRRVYRIGFAGPDIPEERLKDGSRGKWTQARRMIKRALRHRGDRAS